MFDSEKVTDSAYDQRVEEIAQGLASSLGMQNFDINSLDRLTQIISDAAGDRVAYECMYKANVRAHAIISELQMKLSLYENMCNICRAVGRPG